MPGAAGKRPSNVGNDWDSGEEVLANVEVESCQFGVNVDQSFRRDKHRQAVATYLQERGLIFPGNQRSQRASIRMEEVATAQIVGRRLYAEIAHGAAHAVMIVRHMPLGNTSCASAN